MITCQLCRVNEARYLRRRPFNLTCALCAMDDPTAIRITDDEELHRLFTRARLEIEEAEARWERWLHEVCAMEMAHRSRGTLHDEWDHSEDPGSGYLGRGSDEP